MKVFLLSAKSKVDLVAKDIANSYNNVIKVYQNDIGYFDKASKLFNSTGNKRVFVQYNNIIQNDDKYLLHRTLTTVPVNFRVDSNMNLRLQTAFNIVKSMVVQRIYRNNFFKHCVNTVHIGGEEVEQPDEMKINICAIAIETAKIVRN